MKSLAIALVLALPSIASAAPGNGPARQAGVARAVEDAARRTVAERLEQTLTRKAGERLDGIAAAQARRLSAAAARRHAAHMASLRRASEDRARMNAATGGAKRVEPAVAETPRPEAGGTAVVAAPTRS